MKKGIVLLMVTVLAAGVLTACSNKNDQNMDKNMPGMNMNQDQNQKK